MIRIGYLGPQGTYSQEAAETYLVRKAEEGEFVPCVEIPEIFSQVAGGELIAGIIPLENSLFGSVPLTLDLLLENTEDVHIIDEVIIPIDHCLLASSSTEGVDEIKRLFSHSQALAQCRHFIEHQLEGVEQIEVASTAAAARKLVEGQAGWAAIAAETAADFYGLRVLRRGIQDREDNFTRFVVIARRGRELPLTEDEKQIESKISLVFSIPDKPGSLHEILGLFAKRKLNLTRIESRPTKKKLGNYIFYLDFLGDPVEQRVIRVLNELEESTYFFRILGSYPRDPES